MESKAKSSVKPVTKTEKKEAAPPPKPNPAPAEPAEVEKPAQDGNQEGAQEENEAAGGSCETLEHLKPFLIGGAVVALGAVLVGLVLLARKNRHHDDYPDPLLHLWEDCREQVGGLPGTLTGRIYRGRCSGRSGLEEVLLS
ncbi:hypothetical protein QTP86_017484 [Hemibagrus guttatus]|nr:hypothetical protein QTP86_017484 [Hemibagrus guttatus]